MVTHAFNYFLLLSQGYLSFAQNVPTACIALQAQLGSQKVQSSGPGYETGATGAWNLANSQIRPGCIVCPQESVDVQVAMKTIYEFDSRYSVQAGGHSAMIGWDNTQDGVLILFSQMTNISYDAESDTITMEPGIRWGEAVAALEPFGVAPVGGRQSDVSTGLLLGGGLSWLSPAHGFAADSFKSLDVVLVNGTLVTATADNEHADLFRALKGGGSRFGIVTSYKLYPVHTGTNSEKSWISASIMYPNSSAEAVLNATARYVQNVQDPNAVILVTFLSLITAGIVEPLVSVNAFYNISGSNTSSLPSTIFGDFLSIPSINTTITSPVSYIEISNTLPPGTNTGSGSFYGASAIAATQDVSTFAGSGGYEFTVLAFTPVLSPQIQAGVARGGNAIDPPPEDCNWCPVPAAGGQEGNCYFWNSMFLVFGIYIELAILLLTNIQ
ncbi:hypothetical protein BDP27DRAFT_1409392 [Rhodocollybia butyracea]|uniref:FAD-binding PCMH-type domain-containing protein n=1 Tax=Rhodocollybia butyracea TaxID=206335 RepID=A0A9P5P6B7_9AGAR|nr:hypothetical protein BDP27DRAFT_1409392 [Rhodocollybia butyracea]